MFLFFVLLILLFVVVDIYTYSSLRYVCTKNKTFYAPCDLALDVVVVVVASCCKIHKIIKLKYHCLTLEILLYIEGILYI